MDLTSFMFICFYAALLVLYYIVPGKLQWMLLLAFSLLFYLQSGSPVLVLYPFAAVLVSYVCGKNIEKAQQAGDTRLAKHILLTDLFLLIGCLALLKYLKLGSGGGLSLPLGLSFYTFTLAGYAADIYNGIGQSAPSFAGLLTYGMYFPVMTSGPIMKYRESGGQFYERHAFNYDHFTKGLQRMLYGFFKKLVISARAGTVCSEIFRNYENYSGIYIWIGALMFTFQLYTDFSGCMDIVIGLSETLGITLPENFRTPFFSKSIAEYWRRWHITLGVWMREYVFYPLLRSSLFTKIAKVFREKFGKKRGKQYTTFLAMAVLWFTVGLWHGGALKYLIGSGMLHWFYIVAGEVTLPFWKRTLPKLHIPMEGKFADGFRILRTFFLVNIGNVFFNANSAKAGALMLAAGWKLGNIAALWNGGMLELGLDRIEWCVLIVSLLILLAVSLLQEKGSVRDRIAALPVVIRFALWMVFLFYVIILGEYGPGYTASEFIYADF